MRIAVSKFLGDHTPASLENFLGIRLAGFHYRGEMMLHFCLATIEVRFNAC